MSAKISKEKQELQALKAQLNEANKEIEELKVKRAKRNIDFVQVARAELRALAELGEKNPFSLKLLMMFVQSMDKKNAIVMSSKTLEGITGKSRSTITRAIAILKGDKWIQVVKIGTANAYILNEAVFWTDRGDKRKYASFSAQVISSFDEQEKDLRDNPDVKLQRVPILEKSDRVIHDDSDLPPPDQKDLSIN